MGWDAVVERFLRRSPLTVMAHLTLRRALAAPWLDALFAEHAERQYVRSLLFSTVVDLLATVTFGFRPSIHAAVKAAGATLPVSLTALYDKINRTEPALVRAMVREGAQRLAGVLAALTPSPPPGRGGYAVRIVDGNHLPATEKRLKALRGLRGAALPGHTLVVYDPQLGLAIDIVPCEDAHAQERSLTEALLAMAAPGQLWVADRNFSTTRLFEGFADRGTVFIVRKHQRSPTVVAAGALRRGGRTATGTVDEQPVTLTRGDGRPLPLRQVRVHLAAPTQAGDTTLVLLTNVPASQLTARAVAEQYRGRWTIEGMFGELEAALAGELRTLGQPKAALFAFGLAVLAFNVLQVVRRAVEAAHTVDGDVPAVSSYHVAVEIRATYQGFAIATDDTDWAPWDGLSDRRFAAVLRKIAARLNIATVRKSRRAPKTPAPKGYVARSVAQRHHSTARLMAAARIKKTP
jgi:IS4 transposase